MRGLFVLLAIVAVASAGVPAKPERGIIEDIQAVKECLAGVAVTIKAQVAEVIKAVEALHDVVQNGVNSIKKCISLGEPADIATCIINAGMSLKEDVAAAMANIHENVVELASLHKDIIACLKLIGNN